jgi:hypothetical protein
VDPNTCPGDNGGGVIPTGPHGPDCGERTGRFGVSLFFSRNGAAGAGEDDLLIPDGFPEKDHLKLESTSDRLWVDPDDGSGSTNLDSTYRRCPMDLDSYIAQSGDIYTSAHKFPERRLFQKGRKKLVISGSNIARHTGGESTGQTILAWNLRLTRVK